jgi:hypothetical protein
MKRQFVIGRITVQRFASNKCEPKTLRIAMRGSTRLLFCCPAGPCAPPRDYLDRFVALRRP